MSNELVSFCLALGVASTVGCSTVPGTHDVSDKGLLEQAIAAIDDESSACSMLDHSTEDDEVKAALKSRRFEVLEVTRLTDEDGDYRQFVLRADSDDRYLGIVYVEGSACSKYSFGLLRED